MENNKIYVFTIVKQTDKTVKIYDNHNLKMTCKIEELAKAMIDLTNICNNIFNVGALFEIED